MIFLILPICLYLEVLPKQGIRNARFGEWENPGEDIFFNEHWYEKKRLTITVTYQQWKKLFLIN